MTNNTEDQLVFSINGNDVMDAVQAAIKELFKIPSDGYSIKNYGGRAVVLIYDRIEKQVTKWISEQDLIPLIEKTVPGILPEAMEHALRASVEASVRKQLGSSKVLQPKIDKIVKEAIKNIWLE